MTAYQDVRVALQQKLERLQARMGKIQTNLRETPQPDSQEQALDRENDEVLERLEDSGREEISLIQAALARIDAGAYGICTACGAEIASERLSALPYATTCISCAQ
ncbi:MAG: TraR/DksA family transcriptional regulator [Candidatus Binatia bacterium]